MLVLRGGRAVVREEMLNKSTLNKVVAHQNLSGKVSFYLFLFLTITDLVFRALRNPVGKRY